MAKAEVFERKLKQARLVNKTNLDNKLTSFNKKLLQMKTKYLEVQKKVTSLIKKGYNFLLGWIYFTNNDGSQNMFVYQPTLDTLELTKDKSTDYIFIWNKKEYIILNLGHFILLSYIA